MLRGIFVSIIIWSLSFYPIDSVSETIERIAIRVNSEIISELEYQFYIDAIQKRFQPIPTSESQYFFYKEKLISQLIDQLVLMGYARDNSVEVEDSEVERIVDIYKNKLNLRPEEFENYLFDSTDYKFIGFLFIDQKRKMLMDRLADAMIRKSIRLQNPVTRDEILVCYHELFQKFGSNSLYVYQIIEYCEYTLKKKRYTEAIILRLRELKKTANIYVSDNI